MNLDTHRESCDLKHMYPSFSNLNKGHHKVPRVTAIGFVTKVPLSMITHCNAMILTPLEKFNTLRTGDADLRF